MFVPRLDPPVNNMCFCFAKTEIRSAFKCVFLLLYKNAHYGLVIIFRFYRR